MKTFWCMVLALLVTALALLSVYCTVRPSFGQQTVIEFQEAQNGTFNNSGTITNYSGQWILVHCWECYPQALKVAPWTTVTVQTPAHSYTYWEIPAPMPTSQKGDFDDDGDVDIADMIMFQNCFNGPNAPPRC